MLISVILHLRTGGNAKGDNFNETAVKNLLTALLKLHPGLLINTRSQEKYIPVSCMNFTTFKGWKMGKLGKFGSPFLD